LARSTIHGRGIFAIKSISKNACLIEYVGTLIHQTEADRYEKQYREEGITSIYFFTASNDLVIDATKFGNNARYINHSCRPNVYSKQHDVDGQKKIFFHAKRHIEAGEELTIDYNFEYDPLQPRIRCECRRPGCRKYLDL
jgi:SET domain-containing protein